MIKPLAGLTADPGLIVLGILAAAAAVAAAVTPAAATTGQIVEIGLWVAFVAMCRRITTRTGIDPAVVRFWHDLAISGTVFGLGALVILASRAAPPQLVSGLLAASSLLLVAAIAFLGRAMLSYRLLVAGHEQARLWLDVGTVMCALAMLAWHFCLPGGSLPGNTAQFAVWLLGCTMALLAAYAVVMLVLSGSAPFTPAAGVTLSAAILIGAWTVFNDLSVSVVETEFLLPAQLVATYLFFVAARMQHLQMGTWPSGLTNLRRPAYSRLPFLAVGSALLLLVYELWREGVTIRSWGMVAGVVTVALLVMVRQNLAFVDNARLLHQLHHEATHDHLTGLPNRALLEDRAHRMQDDPGRPTRTEAVLLLDLDEFKAVNDELGHHYGDQLLVEVANRLRACVRPTDTVVRLGGDEFVVLLNDTTTAGSVTTAQRILGALAAPVVLAGRTLTPRASIGIAVGPGDQFDALLRDADIAMYQAKNEGSGLSLHPGTRPPTAHGGSDSPPGRRLTDG
ncbi:GGDEF domain-containing protein [Catellatospora sp. NPDC049133]|uniref:GGDEF domain-containing protein n=1 Tax=Catellatospora sp. NPDC049133 TaxID=3155499 RepID=UPI0033E8B97C